LKNSNQHTALLLFAQSAKATAVSKKLVANSKTRNFQASDFLQKKAKLIAQKSDLPYFIIEEYQQQGYTFGEKLSFAFQTIFDLGFDNVIAIGNDCPALTSIDIQNAAIGIAKDVAVIGPDKRKGAYLIGLHRDQFECNSFAQLPWQSKDTLSSLQQYVGRYSMLDVKYDFNQASDFKFILKDELPKNIRFLLSFITGYFLLFVFKLIDSLYKNFLSLTQFLRGPPLFVS